MALTSFSIQTKDRAGPSCQFLVHVVVDNCIFLESSCRHGQSLSVSGNGVASLANFGEDETQFVVRIVVCCHAVDFDVLSLEVLFLPLQRQKYLHSAIINTPFGWPSIAVCDACRVVISTV